MRARIRHVSRKIKKAGGVDIVITHAPPRGYGDAPDNAHRGFECFVKLMDEFHPKYFIHGHVHQSYGDRLPQSFTYGDTTVYNAVGWHILEIDAPEPAVRQSGLGGWFARLKKCGADK